MVRRHLSAGLLVAALAAPGRADDKPKLPEGPPPRLASVLEVRGDVVVYRDYSYSLLIPKGAGPFDPTKPVPSYPATGVMYACSVEFSLKDGQVFDAAGNKLDAGTARKRLAVGDTVLVCLVGRKVDTAYLGVVKKETLVLVPALPLPPALPVPKPPR
jgi:hypothetical protein